MIKTGKKLAKRKKKNKIKIKRFSKIILGIVQVKMILRKIIFLSLTKNKLLVNILGKDNKEV